MKQIDRLKRIPLLANREKYGSGADYDGYVAFCHEQQKDCGEDSLLVSESKDRFLLGVFDGCGGSGAKRYPAFENHTGAWVASRALAVAVEKWFLAALTDEELNETSLRKYIDEGLQACKDRISSEQCLLGTLKKEFPSTMSVIVGGAQELDFYWCGDSRGYIFDGQGLHQVTTDDVYVKDAMQNLREDAPMTNVVNASVSYEIHRRQVEIAEPVLLITATDGCFAYLSSPMEFERLLLETMKKSDCIKEWGEKLEQTIGMVAGDDFSLIIRPLGFANFRCMKRAYSSRLRFMRKNYFGAEECSEEELLAQWEKYKQGYEIMWTDTERKDERD